jgi:hypothetical protein
MIQKTQKVGDIRELQMTDSGPGAEWQTDEKLAATTHRIAQLTVDMALLSGGDSVNSLPVTEEYTSRW